MNICLFAIKLPILVKICPPSLKYWHLIYGPKSLPFPEACSVYGVDWRQQLSHWQNKSKLEMWANAQRDGRPAEYRWRPLFNAAKFGWCQLLQCRAVTLPRYETRWNLQGCPKLPDRSQPLLGWSSSFCGYMWRRYCCLTIFSDCRYVP